VTKASLRLEPPGASIHPDWLEAVIPFTRRDFLVTRFVELPPEHDSPFSYAVRRRHGQLVVVLRCDGKGGARRALRIREIGQSDVGAYHSWAFGRSMTFLDEYSLSGTVISDGNFGLWCIQRRHIILCVRSASVHGSWQLIAVQMYAVHHYNIDSHTIQVAARWLLQ
jgi:hypothetical protein